MVPTFGAAPPAKCHHAPLPGYWRQKTGEQLHVVHFLHNIYRYLIAESIGALGQLKGHFTVLGKINPSWLEAILDCV